VLQALASIANRSTSSFFYSPNLNLYRSRSRKNWREIDIACVSNGELIIGEVKDGAFDQKEFERFADAAELVRPDRAAIFIPHDHLDAKAEGWFSKLHKRLSACGIAVEIYQLPSF
jgi:hypothetical protein